ncbi:hypothetical protein OE88DRAFT_1740454 [Heliocybe sulcata]|uniref:Uncharacterized protein n=1 Tax=Heliocybe sulcata TaxID=5364 RepID=A0A5C3MK15_9AGAM|nr:hypothetical protein OE88DRAFT_1740454 [Heliocybe sulcata]
MHFLKLLKLHRRAQSDSELVSTIATHLAPVSSVIDTVAAAITTEDFNSPRPVSQYEQEVQDEERLLLARIERLEAENALLEAELELEELEAKIEDTSTSATLSDDKEEEEVKALEEKLAQYNWVLAVLDAIQANDPSAPGTIDERLVKYITDTADDINDPFESIRAEMVKDLDGPSREYQRAVDITLAARKREQEAEREYQYWRNKAQEAFPDRELITPSNSVLGIEEVEGRITPTVSTVSISKIEKQWGFKYGEELEDVDGELKSLGSLGTMGSLGSFGNIPSLPSSDCNKLPIAASSSQELVLATKTSSQLLPSASTEKNLASAASSSADLRRKLASAVSIQSMSTPSRPWVSASTSAGSVVTEAVRRLSLIATPQSSPATVRLLYPGPRTPSPVRPSELPFSRSPSASTVQVVAKENQVQDNSWVAVPPRPSRTPSSIRAVNFTPAGEGSHESQDVFAAPPAVPSPERNGKSGITPPRARPAFLKAFTKLVNVNIPGKKTAKETVGNDMSFECLGEEAVVEQVERREVNEEKRKSWRRSRRAGGASEKENVVPVEEAKGEDRRKSWRRSWRGESRRENVAEIGKEKEVGEKRSPGKKSWRASVLVRKENVEEKGTRRLSRLPTLRRKN